MHVTVDHEYNNPAASVAGSKPIRPTNITFPTHHKALQELMRRCMNLNTLATLQSINKVALLTITNNDFLDEQQWATVINFAMTQYGFKKFLHLYPGQAEVSQSTKDLSNSTAETPLPPKISHNSPTRKRKWHSNPS